MSFDWLLLPTQPTVTFVPTMPAVIALFAFAVLAVAATALSINEVNLLERADYRLWFAGVLLSVPASLLLQFSLPEFQTTQPLVLLGYLPIFALALWLGRAPAMSAAAITGILWMLLGVGRITLPFELILFSAAVGLLLHQRYAGQIAAALREPLVTAVLSVALVLWPLNLVGLLTANAADVVNNIERTTTEAASLLATNLIMAAIAALILTISRQVRPDWFPRGKEALQPAPWQTRLRQRVLFTVLPLTVAAIFLLVGTVSLTSYTVATRLVLGQMERDAQNAASSIPFFIQIGQGLIRDLATDDDFLGDDPSARQSDLEAGLRAVPFFEQLTLFNPDLEIIEDTETTTFPLTEAELERVELATTEGVPGELIIFGPNDEAAATLSFIAPIARGDSSEASLALLGRTTLDTNPIFAPVSSFLETGSFESGEGFIVNDQNQILLYPSRPDLHQEEFTTANITPLNVPIEAGQALRQRQPDGSSLLLYILPITGRSDWSVVLIVPNSVVIDLAAQIAVPTLLLMVALTALALTLAILGVQQVTEPIEALSTAVSEIAIGNLDPQIAQVGNDEIGRLGKGFEEMRLRLKGRITELERLLGVTQSVASSLELFRVVPPILGSAIDVTNAISARIILKQENQQIQRYTSGENTPDIASLDEPVLSLVERQGIVVISQLQRATGSLELDVVPEQPAALLAFPLRSDRAFLGVMWVGYKESQVFEEAEVAFLTTLAGQAAASASNALLFTEAQEGRAQLQTVLDSTADGMIVTDQDGRIVLFNPAAKRYLDVTTASVQGRITSDVIEQQDLVRLLTNLQEPVAELEIPGAKGSVILVNTSTIISEGSITGRVAVLRDITAIKELDSIKTVFLRMVSHDLRSPLTFMRGYISMLPIMGKMNDKQMESLAKIDAGIDYISEMTQRLTHLSRLTFGEEAELEYALVDVEDLLADILSQVSSIAKDTQSTISLHVQPDIPLIYADYMLYRQAVYNLINNAIKYGGEGTDIDIFVKVEDDFVHLAVKDTGIGIREEDQARLFEAFYRVPQREGESMRPEGTGLGLALVRAITDAHGGSLSVESTYGEGSTFSISYPIQPDNDL